MTALKICVAIVEDNGSYLSELVNVLGNSQTVEVVGRFDSYLAAVEGLSVLDADVALIDLGLPDGSGIDLIKRIRSSGKTESLVLTVYDDDEHLFPALEAGAVGYILKDQVEQSELSKAIAEAVQGGAPMSLSIARRVLNHFHSSTVEKEKNNPLTPRENEVLAQLAKGFSAKRVAKELDLAYHTVRCHQKNIYKKLHVSSVVAAVSAINNLPDI